MLTKATMIKTESGSVTENDFMISFEQTVAIYVLPGKEMKEKAETIKIGLTSNAWEKRVEHIRRLRGIVKGIEEPENIMGLLRLVENELCACIVDLRSQIVREACITVAYFSFRLGVRLEAAVEPLATALMTLVPNGVRVIATSGKTALKLVYRYTQAKRLLTALCMSLTSSRSTATRQYCCELLCIMCKEWTPRKVEACMTGFCEALKKGICDPDTESRTHARKAFVCFYSRFARHAETLLLSFDTNKRGQLQKELTMNSEEIEQIIVKTAKPRVVDIGTEKRMDVSYQSSTSSLADKPSSPTPKSLQELLPRLNNRASKERRCAMERIQAYILTTPLSATEIGSLVDSFDPSFLENDSDVRVAFLSTMLVLVERCLDGVDPWMKSLLFKLLHFKISPHRNDCSDQVDAVITHVLKRRPDRFFDHCCQIVVEGTASFNAQLNECLCGLILRVLDMMDDVVFDRPTKTLSALVSVLLAWTGDTRHPQLKNVAQQLLLKLTKIDNTRLNEVVATFPYPTQARACTTIAYNNSPSKIPTCARRSVVAASPSLTMIARQKERLGNVCFTAPRLLPLEGKMLTKSHSRGILTSHNLNQPIIDDLKQQQPIIDDLKQQPIRDDLKQQQPIIDDLKQQQPIREVFEQPKLIRVDPTPISQAGLADLVCSLSAEKDPKSTCVFLTQIRSELAGCTILTVEESLASLCAALNTLVCHTNSSVRKHSIMALVRLYSAVGERLWSSIQLDISKRALFDIYVQKEQPRSENRHP